jgi:hypothetical protein
MNARLVRLEMTVQGTLGVLLIDKEIFCFTLEPDANDEDPRIPAGSYLCKRFKGNKWKNTFEIVVAGHTAVLFHSGNTEEATKMCVLLGATTGKLKGQRAVLNSGDTFERFLFRTIGINEFQLVIEDSY